MHNTWTHISLKNGGGESMNVVESVNSPFKLLQFIDGK